MQSLESSTVVVVDDGDCAAAAGGVGLVLVEFAWQTAVVAVVVDDGDLYWKIACSCQTSRILSYLK